MKLKKISLQNVSDLLSENEMKFVTGGYYGSGVCTVTCNSGQSYTIPYGNCMEMGFNYCSLNYNGAGFSCNDDCWFN